MPDKDKLDPDSQAVEKWQGLPQNKPSKDALPPASGGIRQAWLLIAAFILIVVVLIIARGIT